MFSTHFLNKIKKQWEYNRVLVINRSGAFFDGTDGLESTELEWLERASGLKAGVKSLVAAGYVLKIGYTGIINNDWAIELIPPPISLCCGNLHTAVSSAVIEAHR